MRLYTPTKNYSTLTASQLRRECDKLERLKDDSLSEYEFEHYQFLIEDLARVVTKKKIKL